LIYLKQNIHVNIY